MLAVRAWMMESKWNQDGELEKPSQPELEPQGTARELMEIPLGSGRGREPFGAGWEFLRPIWGS